MIEIERKFLVNDLPDFIKELPRTEITQLYLTVGEEEIRLRKTVSDSLNKVYQMTVKKGKGLQREEFEIAISRASFNQLISYTKVNPLKKSRFHYKEAGYVIEVDVFHQLPLVIAEVEFPSLAEAEAFQPLSWFGVELTNNVLFNNQSLWLLRNGGFRK